MCVLKPCLSVHRLWQSQGPTHLSLQSPYWEVKEARPLLKLRKAACWRLCRAAVLLQTLEVQHIYRVQYGHHQANL